MVRAIISFLFIFLLVMSCSKSESNQETTLEQSKQTEKAAMEKENPVGTYGKGITLKEKTLLSTIMEAPEKYEGKQVLLAGTIVEVCPKRGCWVELSGDKEFEKIKVKVKDGEIVFPLSAKGSEALIEGTVEKLELTQKQAINYLAHQAEEKGTAFDSTSVLGPLNIWRIRGLGADIKG
jgi:Domain of unknown function (DUF4920)